MKRDSKTERKRVKRDAKQSVKHDVKRDVKRADDAVDKRDRAGAPALGLYPHVSRTALAEATGYDIATISGILRGRTKLKLEPAVVMAQIIGIDVAQLNQDLEAERTKFLARKSQQSKSQAKRTKKR